MKVKCKITHKNGKLPTYATDGSGAIDFYAARHYTFDKNTAPEMVNLGVAMEVPKGHVLLLFPRSSIGANTPLRMANSVGVIDSDYRGTIHALYESHEEFEWEIVEGDRVAQGFIIPVPKIELEEVDELSETTRGDGGFGSTGR